MLFFFYRKLSKNFLLSGVILASCWLGIRGLSNDETLDLDSDNLIINDVNNVNTGMGAREELLVPESASLYVNVSEHPGEKCKRVCVSGAKRICHFEFTIEYYQVMGVACGQCSEGVAKDCNNPQCIVADGVERGAMSINRQIPGPAIQVCKDDFIIVDVHNNAHGSAASIHWHGLHMIQTPYMDGVPFLTQCPIPFSSSFRYQFYTTEAGTQFYHSHSGHQKSNGQFGALIVRQAEEPLSDLYDYDLPDHHILIADWMHQYAEQHFPGLTHSPTLPKSVLINGRGTYTNPISGEQTQIPPTVYYVEPGKRYRFRLINSVNHVCAFQIQIEKHNLTIIASDSFEVEPFTIDTLISNAGERYDFIVTANEMSGDFWIRVRGLGLCSQNPMESYALLRYQTSEIIYSENDLDTPPHPGYEDLYPLGKSLNSPKATCFEDENNHCVTELTAYEEDADLLNSTPDKQFFLAFQNQPVPSEEVFKPGQYNHFASFGSTTVVLGAINNLSLTFPDYPALTQPDFIDESQFCDDSSWPAKCGDLTVCPCIHRLKVELNDIIELIIVDESNANLISHPFHLHGYRFMVTGLGQNPNGLPMSLSQAKELESRSMLPRIFANNRPPFKDTVSIPGGGYAIIRFKANNPGFWLMHCHYEWHLAIGMGLILQVGNTADMIKPPNDFPKCGSYLPAITSQQKVCNEMISC